jgi:Leucine-rich repeat (LRR) protein
VNDIWLLTSFGVESAGFYQADFGKTFFVINAVPGHTKPMFSWKQLEAQLRQIINTVIRFIKARRHEEASITFGAFLIWAGIYIPEWLEKAGMKEFVGPWYGDKIGRSVLIAAGAGLVLYAAFKIFRLVYVPDLPPPQDRPSAIKGPMAFTEDDGALFRKLGRENDLQKLLGLILDNQVVMVIVRGASGAGKTSLLRAGLTHILAEKGVKYHYWEAAPTEPDKWLLHAIQETWPDGGAKPSSLDELVNPSDGLGRQAHVIVLDQFEQLRGSKPIFRLMRKIAREAKPPHRITWVIAFRREFSADWMDFVSPEQERGFRPPQDLSLRLFTAEQAREVIGQLVNESNLSIEQSVVDNLVEAATREGEVSPVDIGIGLLVLAELSERQSGRTVTIRDYQFAGGAEGLLTQYISRCLELFAKEDKETILKAMLALRNPETSERIAEGLTIDELAKEAGAEARLLKPLLDRLAQRDARLLEIVTTPGQSPAQYRLPHERLIPALYRLTGKLLAEVDQARLKFENAFLAWQKNGERSHYLMKGNDLRLVERFETKIPWGANAQEKQSFLGRSKRRRRFVKAARVAGGLALIMAGLQYQRSEDRRFLRESGYPPMLYDSQRQLKKLALTEPLDLERFTWLSSNSIKELELRAALSSNSIAGLVLLSRCNSLKTLTLDISRSQVSNLEPLARLSNLTQLTLDISRNNGINLEPLAKLSNLTRLTLDLTSSRVSNLEPLAKLSNLTQLTLSLSRSEVGDLEPLAKLGNLTQLTLDLGSSQGINLEPLLRLSKLTQLTLDLSYGQGINLEPLAKLSNLTQLTLGFSSSKGINLEPLAKLSDRTQLKLELGYSQGIDLEPLAKLGNLTQLTLEISFSQGINLDSLAKLSNLAQLTLTIRSGRGINLEPLAKLSNLTQLTLNLSGSEVGDLEPLAKLGDRTQLKLDLGSSQGINLEALAKLSNLTHLRLYFNSSQGINLEPLAKLSNLTQLSLEFGSSQGINLEPLSKMSNLKRLTLDLGSSQGSNLEPLARLSNLTQLSLYLSSSQGSNLEPLAKLGNLAQLTLDLSSSQGSNLEPLAKLAGLRTLSIEDATRAQRMSLRNIPASLVELEF